MIFLARSQRGVASAPTYLSVCLSDFEIQQPKTVIFMQLNTPNVKQMMALF